MALACDGTNVYWSDWDGVLGDADEIRQATVAGTDVLTLDGQAVADVNSIAVEGTTVAYMAQSGAYFCAATVSHSQSGACSLALGEGPAGGWVVSASANSFYELSAFDTIGPTYEVSSCAGLACTALPGVGEAQSAISLAYVPGSSALFWVAANEINYWNVAASLQGMVAPVTSDEVNPALLTSDGTYLYWIDSGTTIKRVLASPSIGTPSTVAGPLALPAQNPNSSIGVNDWIATDGKNVFFGATGPNGVGLYAAPVGGGAPILVAGALSTSPPALTIQYGGWLYWFENATLPVIRRMATP
jgi:hypothetical protein